MPSVAFARCSIRRVAEYVNARIGRRRVNHSARWDSLLIFETCDQPEEAVRRSHQLQSGLAGYVFGANVADAMRIGRQLPVGEVKINGTSLLDMSDRSSQEFWHGSGVGGHGDLELANFFTGARIVGVDEPSDL